jgi:capsular exopolysaccharide synthesis family protein
MSRKGFSESIAEILRLSALDVGGSGKSKDGSPSGERIRGPVDEKLVVFAQSRSLAAEYFHYLAVKTEKALGAGGEGGKIVLVTGPGRGSGKSLCSLNLALAFAKTYRGGVLFLDADSRAGQAQSYLGYGEAPMPGFTDVLERRCQAESVLLDTGIFDLAFLPSGAYVENLISRASEKEIPLLFESLRKRFNLVIIDTPPAFPLPEAGILAAFSDGVIIVLGAGRDGESHLNQTVDALKGTNILGAVLNNLPSNMEQQSRYTRYGRYYGYGDGGRNKGREQG